MAKIKVQTINKNGRKYLGLSYPGLPLIKRKDKVTFSLNPPNNLFLNSDILTVTGKDVINHLYFESEFGQFIVDRIIFTQEGFIISLSSYSNCSFNWLRSKLYTVFSQVIRRYHIREEKDIKIKVQFWTTEERPDIPGLDAFSAIRTIKFFLDIPVMLTEGTHLFNRPIIFSPLTSLIQKEIVTSLSNIHLCSSVVINSRSFRGNGNYRNCVSASIGSFCLLESISSNIRKSITDVLSNHYRHAKIQVHGK